jgi:hypothetical protein
VRKGATNWDLLHRQEYRQRQNATRNKLRAMLGFPKQGVELTPEKRGQIERDGVVVEKWVLTLESGSKVPCLLFRPSRTFGKMPAVVLTFGHGGSKSFWSYQYAGQLYARLGVACLAMDPIGEEERHAAGRRGTREHDLSEVDRRSDSLGRPVLGKMVFDATRGVDFLLTRNDIDPKRIGLAGNSLGGAVAQFTAAVDDRLRLVFVSGWMYDSYLGTHSKPCTATPMKRANEICSFDEMLALSAPQCAVLILNGSADVIIENRPPIGNDSGGEAFGGNHRAVAEAKKVYTELGGDPSWVDEWYSQASGHREYFNDKFALEWIYEHLGTSQMTLDEIRRLPTVNSGKWCDMHQLPFERLYGTELHQRGQVLPDLSLRPFTDRELAVLNRSELGQPEFTIKGWLDAAERAR